MLWDTPWESPRRKPASATNIHARDELAQSRSIVSHSDADLERLGLDRSAEPPREDAGPHGERERQRSSPSHDALKLFGEVGIGVLEDVMRLVYQVVEHDIDSAAVVSRRCRLLATPGDAGQLLGHGLQPNEPLDPT